MNSDLKEIKRELELGLKQWNSDAQNSLIIVNPSKENQNLNFVNHSIFKDVFATLNNVIQIHNSNERTNWKQDIVRNYFYQTLTQTNQQSIRMLIMIPSILCKDIITYVKQIFAFFDDDQGLSILVYDTLNFILMKDNVFKLIQEIINQNDDKMVCSFLNKLYNSRRIIHMNRSEIQDKVEIEDFPRQQVSKSINQERLQNYFSLQQNSEDELRKCQVSLQRQFDSQLDQIIGILLENLQKMEAQAIVEQEILQKLQKIEEKINNFQLGDQSIQELSQLFMEAIQLLSQEQLQQQEIALDALNINLEMMDFYNRNHLGQKFIIKLSMKVGLKTISDMLKVRQSRCSIM